MKSCWLTCLCSVLLFSGCRTGQNLNWLTPVHPTEKFAVSVLLVDVSRQEERRTGSDVGTWVAEAATEPVRFPPVLLDVGETREVNGQVILRYPAEFELDGTVSEFKETTVGKRLVARLTHAPNGQHQLKIELFDGDLREWRDYGAEEYKAFWMLPVCRQRQFVTSLILAENAWKQAGAMDADSENMGRRTLVFVRIDSPQPSASNKTNP